MKKDNNQNKPLEINPTTVIQLDPENLEGVVGGLANKDSTRTGDSCDGCTYITTCINN